MNLENVSIALLGGVLPALVWLLFWLREDKKHPEPKNLVARTFLLGMLAVPLVLPLQKITQLSFPELTIIPVLIWAALEETFKFLAAYFGGIHSVEDNEPIDPLIYMITAALGFVAMENTLFIFSPILAHSLSRSLITGNLRFIGASLLHIVSSGFVGIALSFSFYSSKARKIIAVLLALAAAAAFHTLFNMLIINLGDFGTTWAFVMVWIAVIPVLLSFERAKILKRLF